jgi:hypothetical protein
MKPSVTLVLPASREQGGIQDKKAATGWLCRAQRNRSLLVTVGIVKTCSSMLVQECGSARQALRAPSLGVMHIAVVWLLCEIPKG